MEQGCHLPDSREQLSGVGRLTPYHGYLDNRAPYSNSTWYNTTTCHSATQDSAAIVSEALSQLSHVVLRLCQRLAVVVVV